jgi:NADPH-ferrihemoprotein reductase
MNAAKKDLVVFFGSQTGNSQDLAERLAKEGHSRFGLQTMAADLEDYDYETLVNFPPEKVAVFLLSSYGEGEPTDNAVQFFEFITSEEYEGRLDNMRYAMFGLGNSSYEHFNLVARKVDASLLQHGAKRLGALGEGDDAKGSTEDAFLSWKDELWQVLSSAMGLREQETQLEPSFTVSEVKTQSEGVFLGERSVDELNGTKYSPSGRHNPRIVPVRHSRELFRSTDRSCLHVELDIANSDLEYETGDHVSIWPMNSNAEVDRFLRVFGLLDKRHDTIHVSAVDGVSQVPIPTPTTYDAAARYYLEIAGPVSRQFLQTCARFAVDQQQKKALARLGNDKDYFAELVSSQMLNLAQLIEKISPNNPACPIPFAILIEGVRALQPRCYSISSSSLVENDRVAITAVVKSTKFDGRWFKGVATNYLLGLKQQKCGGKAVTGNTAYALSGPRGKYELSVAAHVRQSHFRLPSDISRPVIMVGPGTGVAPFRAFIQERAAQLSAGLSPGKMLLFYGCRTMAEDFVYEDEWKVRHNHGGLLLTCLEQFRLRVVLGVPATTRPAFYNAHIIFSTGSGEGLCPG